MSNEHTYRPSEEFRARLERKILRRNRRPLAGPMPHGDALRSRARIAAVAVISLILGATAGFASAQIGQNAQRDSLLAAARAEATLANAQRDLAAAEVREAERKFQTGLIGIDARTQANAALAEAERRSSRMAIDIEEITATGTPPRDNLNAPVVNGRDFVKLRIESDAVGAQARLRAAEVVQKAIDARARVGVASNVTSGAAALDVTTVRAELALLAQKLALRKEFLEKGTSIEELTRRLQAAQWQQEMNVLMQRVASARDRMVFIEQQRPLGTVGEVEVLRARLEFLELDLSLRKLLERSRARP